MPAVSPPRPAAALAAALGAPLHGDGARLITGVAPLAAAGPGDLCFSRGPVAPGHPAGLVLARAPADGATVAVVKDPDAAFAALLHLLFPVEHPAFPGEPPPLVHPTATVHPGAWLGPGVVVGPRCTVGPDTALHPRVVLVQDVTLGARCTVGPGSVLGGAGFALRGPPEALRRVPQVGALHVADDVTIGALCTIARGALADTRIGPGCHLDDQVHIAHNVVLGRGVRIAAQAGIAGSATIGDFAVLGGQVGVADHAVLGPGVHVAAQSGVHGRVHAGAALLGSPAGPLPEMRRALLALRQLPGVLRALRRAGIDV